VRKLATVAGISLLLMLGTMSTEPWVMRVIDAQTGAGVSGLRVVTDSGLVCYTNKTGEITWPEWSLVGRRVRFTITDVRQQFAESSLTARPMFGVKRGFTLHRRTTTP